MNLLSIRISRKVILSARSWRFALSLMALILGLFVTAPAAAGAEPGAAPLKITVSTPAKPLELLEAWRVIVTVENVSSNTVALKELRWLVPPQLRSTRKVKTPPAPGVTPAAPEWDDNALRDEPTLEAGQIGVFPLTMPSTYESGECWFFNPTILTWHYPELDVPILVAYTDTGADGTTFTSGTVTQAIKVQWLTPFRTLVFGGILGALLAMAFYYFYLRLDVVSRYFAALKGDSSTPPRPTADVWKGLKNALDATFPEHISIAWRQMVTACVTVTIVLLLVASGKEGMLPISIAVTDFAGAAFLGLIAHKIGKVTFDAIFGGGKDDTAAPAAKGVPDPELKAEWDASAEQVVLTWQASADPKVTGYSLRRLVTATDDPLTAPELKSFSPTDKLEFATADGLNFTGDQAFYVLILKRADGSEQAGTPLTFTRPPGSSGS